MRLSGQAKFRGAVKSEFFNSIGDIQPLDARGRQRLLSA